MMQFRKFLSKPEPANVNLEEVLDQIHFPNFPKSLNIAGSSYTFSEVVNHNGIKTAFYSASPSKYFKVRYYGNTPFVAALGNVKDNHLQTKILDPQLYLTTELHADSKDDIIRKLLSLYKESHFRLLRHFLEIAEKVYSWPELKIIHKSLGT